MPFRSDVGNSFPRQLVNCIILREEGERIWEDGMSQWASNPEHSSEIDAAVAAWYLAAEREERPDRAAFLQQYPHLATELLEFLADFDKFQQLAGAGTKSQAAVETSRTGAGNSQPGNAGAETSIPKNFGRYQIEKELGKGAMGVVYLAEDTQLRRKVALKIPAKSSLDDPQTLERFYREAQTSATLRHPNICPVFDVGSIDGTHYLTMAYIPGKPVSAFLTKNKLPAAKQVALLIRKIALAIEDAHQHGIVHRDLKPSNVMLDQRNEPIVMDFGLARQTNNVENARLTQSGAILGTPAYMAPEQVEGEIDQVGPQSDIYALGVMLYQFLTGDLPFQGPILKVFSQIQHDEPKRPRDVRAGVPAALEAICLKMMAKQPAQRYASMKEAAAALTEFIKQSSMAGPAPVMPKASEVANVERDLDEKTLLSLPDVAIGRRKAKAIRRIKPPASRRKHKFWIATGASVLALTLLFAIVLWMQNDKVAVRVAIDDPTAVVKIDGKQLRINGDGIGELRLTLQEHTFTVQRTDEEIESPQTFTITKNGTRLLDLRRKPVNPKIDVVEDQIRPATSPPHTSQLGVEGIARLKSALPQGEATVYSGNPAAKIDYALHRKAAEIFLAQNKLLNILPENGFVRFVGKREDLPESDFRLVALMPGTLGSGNAITRKGWELIQRTQVKEMTLSPDPLNEEDIADLAKCQELITLSFYATPLTASNLSALSSLKQLGFLSFGRTGIDRAGLKALKNFPVLHTLHLLEPAIGNEDLELLAGLPITTLRIGNPAFTDRALDILDRGPKLNLLNIYEDTQISQMRLQKFAADHPQCVIQYGPDEKPKYLNRRAGNPAADAPAAAVVPFNADQAKDHQEAWAKHLGVPVEYTNSIGMKFRLIPPGEFMRGSTPEEIQSAIKFTDNFPNVSGAEKEEWIAQLRGGGPQHKVILTRPFYLGVHEVTQGQYKKIMATNPSWFTKTGPQPQFAEKVAGMDTPGHPVEYVSWNDGAEFCAKLSNEEKLKPFYFRAYDTVTPLDGTGYRFPSEAEWEFACRAGTTTKSWAGDREEDFQRVDWFDLNSGGRTHAVGELKSNPWGLFDMQGNVCEWVEDAWHATYYEQFANKPAIDPSGWPFSTAKRVYRSLSFQSPVYYWRLMDRAYQVPFYKNPDSGFRAALSVESVRKSLTGQPTETKER